ncbi:alpha/beta hydrolase family protein [Flindersiella endophytica]
MKTRLKSFILAGVLAIPPGAAAQVATNESAGHPALEPLAYTQRIDHGRRFLAYDRQGDGRVVEVLGDLRTAQRVAVVVPGSGHRLGNLTTSRSGAAPRRNGEALLAELERQAPQATELNDAAPPRVAVVIWTGYDTPERVNVDAARSERAIPGGRDLARLTKLLTRLAPAAETITLTCHSYGSVVCGRAAPAARADNIVVVGSPGMDAGRVSDLRTKAHVWAARTADDPIRFVPDVRVGGFGHGEDPSKPGFGAEVFRTGEIHAHDSYYEPGSESLANIARIVLGRDDEVTKK